MNHSAIQKSTLMPSSCLKGYKASVFAENLTTPINLIITDQGDMLLADSGLADGIGKVLIYNDNQFDVLASGFNPPVTGINYHEGHIYVSHRGFITTIKAHGTMTNIISGLPSWGHHQNNQVIFGPDKKMYFGQGTASNSGVIGEDDTASSPFNVSLSPNTRIASIIPANGSIIKANPDGTNMELVAWGLRNPFRIKFDRFGRLFCINHGCHGRGSRPIAQCPDEFQFIMPGVWYGWPDYSAGLPVTLPRFKVKGRPAPRFLLADHPMKPPRPFATFPNQGTAMGFDFNHHSKFGHQGDAYIARLGPSKPAISKLSMNTGKVSDFALNKSGLPSSTSHCGGFERPIDLVFDKNGHMYLVDFESSPANHPHEFIPGTGLIWKISKV